MNTAHQFHNPLLSPKKPQDLIALGRDWSGSLVGGGGEGHWKKTSTAEQDMDRHQ